MQNVRGQCVPCVMTDTDSFYVKVCGCGVVHLNFGPTLLNLSPEVLVAVSETLKEVAQGIRLKWNEDLARVDHLTPETDGTVIQGRFPRY